MENKKMNFEVKITDLATGEEKYCGLTNCIFLVCNEELGSSVVRLSQCSIIEKASCYNSVNFAYDDELSDDPILSVLVHALSDERKNFVVVDDTPGGNVDESKE